MFIILKMAIDLTDSVQVFKIFLIFPIVCFVLIMKILTIIVVTVGFAALSLNILYHVDIIIFYFVTNDFNQIIAAFILFLLFHTNKLYIETFVEESSFFIKRMPEMFDETWEEIKDVYDDLID